ncbi:TonB-dependent receptor [Hufsiella ginkgonis]|uniref:TonB-dependent receptor n=1 Tax=Hufsiella ginkgonis TaxID=2695274 RepID=A0A7K1Y132_9SPHI|nr:TonB-dependent receptor [Hufsiella ginkgonis]MXV16955.1 TonB-dependent receptor [Hufsiella ginkgonis]
MTITVRNAGAQNAATGTFTAKVADAGSGQPIEFAAVTLKNSADSTKVFGAVTGSTGQVKLLNIPAGAYNLRVSYLGYRTIERQVRVEVTGTDAGTILLDQSGIDLKEIAVKGEKAAVTLKKDTLEFNAGSFKTRPDATTEELLKKLPGVEVDKDGNITVGGQRASRLTVDGKDFFGTDPKTATKNLPADAIDKVQIVDSKTQEAKTTGIDDGQREKVLNLTIKKDKKKGWFGNATASMGNTDRYNGYLSANSFSDTRQLAILAMSNNVNAANFSFDDLSAFSGGNIGDVFAPPAGGSFSINVNNGTTTIGGSGVFDNAARGIVNTHAGGINYSNEFGKKKNLKVSSSYFTYFSDGVQNKFSDIQDLGKNDILRTTENSLVNSDNFAHRANMKVEYHPDTLTDIFFRPNVIYNHTENVSSRNFQSNYDQGGNLNAGTQNFKQYNTQPSYFGEFTALRRLGYQKGSLSVRINGTWTKATSDWNNISALNTFTGGNPVTRDINQDADQYTRTQGFTLNGNYARPLGKKWSSNVTYTYNESNSLADQVTFDYNPVTDKYEVIVPSLTNRFDYTNWNQAARLGFINTPSKVLNYNFGVSLQQPGLTGKTIFNNGGNEGLLNKDYWNLLPRFSLNYNPANNRSLQVNYAETVVMPSAINLQPVQNNTNPLFQREGNPDLQPRKNHRLTLNFNTFKPGTDYYWNGYFAYNVAFDAITNDTRVENGVQYYRPLNVDGNFNINTGSYFGMPTGLKGLRLNLGINVYADHSKNFISSVANATDRLNLGPNASINYDIADKLNVSYGTYYGYNKVNNQLKEAQDDSYLNIGNNLNISYEFIKDFRIETEINHNGVTGRPAGYNINYFLWNASLVKYFMNRRINVAFRGFDILDQNTNVNRSVFNTRIEDTRYNNLTRYFYLSLTYRLAKAGAGNERRNPRNTVN